MKYYLHDCNSFNDDKISELFLKFGYEGLGLFYTILERIGSQEKPIKTLVLKSQLQVGRRLEKCWMFMEEIKLISSNNGETFNERILSYSETYRVKKEKNREKISEWRKNQTVTENVTSYELFSNPSKVNESKVKVNNKANAFVADAATKVSKVDYEKLLEQQEGKELKEVVMAMKEFLLKKPTFFDPYMDYWNIAVEGSSIPKVKSGNDSRVRKLKTRISESDFDFVEIIKIIKSNTKLKTESPWFGFDWVFENQTNYVKILEGNYNG